MTMFHTGQRIKVKQTGKTGIIAAIDKDMSYIYVVRLDDGQYITLSASRLEAIHED